MSGRRRRLCRQLTRMQAPAQRLTLIANRSAGGYGGVLLPRGHPCAVRAWRWLLSSSGLVFQWQEGAGNAGRVQCQCQWAAVLAHHQVFLGLAEVRIAVFSVTFLLL